MRNESVTPSGMPPCRNPTNSGIDEQEQNGVTAPKPDATRSPPIKIVSDTK